MYRDPVYCPDQCTANACACHFTKAMLLVVQCQWSSVFIIRGVTRGGTLKWVPLCTRAKLKIAAETVYITEGSRVSLRRLQAIEWQRFIHALPDCMLTDSRVNRDCCTSFVFEVLVLAVLVFLAQAYPTKIMHLHWLSLAQLLCQLLVQVPLKPYTIYAYC